MKVKTCPKCGSKSLGERWAKGRKLEQYCNGSDGEDCYWVGEPYTPSKKRIANTDTLRLGEFVGWHYIVYDKYGHVQTDSATYGTREEALKELVEDVTPRQDYVDPAAPLTAVLFNVPASIVIKGTMYRFKKGGVNKV